MKFEEFLMRPSEDQRRKLVLENEIMELQERLDGELKLNSVLRWAMKGPVLSFHCLPPQLPLKVRVLLTELAVAEEQIMWLERKVRKLKLTLNNHKKNKTNLHRQTSEDTRIHETKHKKNSNLMSPRNLKTYTSSVFDDRGFSTPRISSTFLFSTPWRRNAYMCGS